MSTTQLICESCEDSADIPQSNNAQAMEESGWFAYPTTDAKVIWLCESCHERACQAQQRLADIFRDKSKVVRLDLPEPQKHKHTPRQVDLEDITEADRALVRDFWDNNCHAEWCEFDELELYYMLIHTRKAAEDEARLKWENET